MNRSVLLMTAVGAVLSRAAFADDLTISTATTSPVATSTAANSSPGNVTISTGGSVTIATAGAAVTLDSSNSVSNGGTISNTVAGSGTGVSILGGNAGSFVNSGTISVVGTSATDTNELGILLSGTGAFTGDIVTANGSTVTVSGASALAIAIQSELAGNLTLAGTIKGTGTSANAIKTTAAIDGAFVNSGTISAVSGTTSTTLVNASPGSAVAIGANVGAGILNSQSATISVVGSSPALAISPTANAQFGVLTDASNPGYSFINRGQITSIGEQVAVAATAIQIGGSGYLTQFSGGVYNSGSIIASATSDNSKATAVTPTPTGATAMIIGSLAQVPTLVNEVNGTISATTDGPAGGTATALSIASDAKISSLNNAGTILASANTTDTSITSLSAVALQDSSGSLTSIVNSGTISATATALDGGGQGTVAANLAVANGPITFTNTGTVTGDITFGSAPGNELTIEGSHAIVTGKVATTGNAGRVNLAISSGGTGGTLITSGAIKAGTLTVGPGGVLNLTINPTNNGISASGPASFDASSRLQVASISVLPQDINVTLVHSDTALTFGNYSATTAGIQIPFLYHGSLISDEKNVVLSLQRKSGDELGLTGNGATLYEPAMLAATTDNEFGVAIAGLGSAAEIQSSIQQMLPILSGASRAMADAITDSTTDAVATRQRSLTLAPDIEQGTTTWVQGYYDHLRNTQSDGYSGHGTAAVAGIDYSQTGNGHFGIAFSYYRGDMRERDQPQDRTTAQWVLAEPYIGLRSGNVFINAQLNVGVASVHTARTVQAGSVVRTPTSNSTQWLVAGGLTGGYVLNLGGFSLIPQVNVNAFDLAQADLTESGGGTGVDLAMQGRNDTSSRAFVGLAAGGTYAVFGGHIVPQVVGGWSHELVKASSSIEGAFAAVADSSFTVSGRAEQRSRVVAGGSLDFVKDKWMVSLGADASIQSEALVETVRMMVAAHF